MQHKAYPQYRDKMKINSPGVGISIAICRLQLMCIQWVGKWSSERHFCTNITFMIPVSTVFWSRPSWKPNYYFRSLGIHFWVNISQKKPSRLLIIINVLFHHHDFDYYWDFFVHRCSLWTLWVKFLKLCNFVSAIVQLLRCFCPWTFF